MNARHVLSALSLGLISPGPERRRRRPTLQEIQDATNSSSEANKSKRRSRHEAAQKFEFKLHSAATMDRWDRLQVLRHHKGSYQRRRAERYPD